MVSSLQMKVKLIYLFTYHRFNSQVLMNFKIIKRCLLMLKKAVTVKTKLQI